MQIRGSRTTDPPRRRGRPGSRPRTVRRGGRCDEPAACGVFLVRDHATLDRIDHQIAYLNEDTAEPGGVESLPHLLGKSLATTRRLDAFKLLVSFHVLGRAGVAARLDRLLALTAHAARTVDAEPALVRVHDPVMMSLVFRYLPGDRNPTASDQLNDAIRSMLLRAGVAVAGRTRVAGRIAQTGADLEAGRWPA